jgi:Spy/CpxP family protein refolding chaperone
MMRRLALITAAALALTACSSDTTAPDNTDLALLGAGTFGTALTTTGGYEAGVYQDRLGNALPDELKLTDAQKAAIKSLVDAFQQATKADREALGAILREARQAVEAKKSRSEVQAILAHGLPIAARLAQAEAKLKSDIDAVLTPEQRAWIAAHSPRGCRADRFPPLTDAQKAQIHALEAAFQTQNKADIDAVKAILDEAAAAIRAGKSHDEVAAILEKARAPMQRLESARKELREKILAVLTPEQKASGCLPLG